MMGVRSVRVRMGWSGETQPNTWQKVDIELEEEDLHRLMQENDLPDRLQDKLPTRVCYQLLQNEAEVMLLNKLKFYGYPVDKANARQAVLAGSSHEILAAIKNQLTAA